MIEENIPTTQDDVATEESKTWFWLFSLLSPFVGFGMGVVLCFMTPSNGGGFIPSGPINAFLSRLHLVWLSPYSSR